MGATGAPELVLCSYEGDHYSDMMENAPQVIWDFFATQRRSKQPIFDPPLGSPPMPRRITLKEVRALEAGGRQRHRPRHYDVYCPGDGAGFNVSKSNRSKVPAKRPAARDAGTRDWIVAGCAAAGVALLGGAACCVLRKRRAPADASAGLGRPLVRGGAKPLEGLADGGPADALADANIN